MGIKNSSYSVFTASLYRSLGVFQKLSKRWILLEQLSLNIKETRDPEQ